MKRKKAAAVFLALCLLSLTACSGEHAATKSTDAPEAAPAVEATSATETSSTADMTVAETGEIDAEMSDEIGDMYEDTEFELPPIPDDLTGGWPWIDSNIIGNVTADTVTSPKDDFYLWVNKDWLATAKIPEGMESVEISTPADSNAELKQALTEKTFSDHDARQAQLLFRAFSDTDARTAAGAAPVKKVIDDISSVSGIDELNAFLLDTERSAGVPTLISISNKQDDENGHWESRIEQSDHTFRGQQTMMGVNAANVDRESDAFKACYALVCHILTQAGYTEEQAKAAFENRLEFEKELIKLTDEA